MISMPDKTPRQFSWEDLRDMNGTNTESDPRWDVRRITCALRPLLPHPADQGLHCHLKTGEQGPTAVTERGGLTAGQGSQQAPRSLSLVRVNKGVEKPSGHQPTLWLCRAARAAAPCHNT